ncbi:ocs element-binding factor 1 [Musa troglodytarum]|uniref:Ocs element-binding factor 1 n=1 Tax=Musa troglodytarum TaxID=320322 RepID=A0A9E7EFI7_9LILI|nr:ocs element-binding factor 1 [Musa troglodytarum]
MAVKLEGGKGDGTYLDILDPHHAAVFRSAGGGNSVLRTQMVELSNRLQSLNDILHCLKAKYCISSGPTDNFINPWNLMRMNQPIMALAENMFQY